MNTVDDFFNPPKQLPKHLDGSSLQVVPDVLGSDPKPFLDPFSECEQHEGGPLGSRMPEALSEEEGWKPRKWWSPCPGATPGCAHTPVPLSKNASASPFSLEQIQLKPPLPAPVEEALNCTWRSSHSNQVARCKNERNTQEWRLKRGWTGAFHFPPKSLSGKSSSPRCEP